MDRLDVVDSHEDLPHLEKVLGCSSLSLELSILEIGDYYSPKKFFHLSLGRFPSFLVDLFGG